MPGTYAHCVEVGPDCPVEASIYGYKPNMAANSLFLAIFALSAIAHTYQGFRHKTWTFLVGLGIGCVIEAVGQGGRLMLNHNVWDDVGFDIQIVFLTIAPAFLAAGIYLTLKHLVITFGSHLSRLPPAWYTYIFITCDFFSLVLQGAGGGIAATADTDNMLNVGDNLMIAGLAFQVFTLIVFAVLSGSFFYNVWRHHDQLNPSTRELRSSRQFKLLLGALIVSYTTILVRCIYRVIEMAGGWGNSIMQDEVTFIILDPTMIAIAVLALNLFHPGRFLSSMSGGKTKQATEGSETRGKTERSSGEVEMV